MYPPWAIPNDPRIAMSNMDAVFPQKGETVMADKVERWRVCEVERWRVYEIKRGSFSYIGIETTSSKVIIDMGLDTGQVKADAELICALHNAALNINPSNPMAVAEGLGDLVKSSELALEIGAQHGMAVFAWYVKMKKALAAITKPATKETDV